MIDLLCDCQAEFPDEYLVARIRGRREERRRRMLDPHSALAAKALPDEEAIDTEHEAEVRWLYRQMARKTREGVAPLFVLFELRRLVNWLRQADEAMEWDRRATHFFSRSLWHTTILRECSRCGTVKDVIDIMENRITSRVPACKGLTLQHEHNTLLEAERQMTTAVLVHGASKGKSALLRDLSCSLIDFCNISGLVKSWLWKLSAPPQSIPAGHLSPVQLERIWREGAVSRAGLPASARKDTITPGQIAALEEEKRKAIWSGIRNKAKQLDPIAVIIDYLYFLEAEAVHLRGHLSFGVGEAVTMGRDQLLSHTAEMRLLRPKATNRP